MSAVEQLTWNIIENLMEGCQVIDPNFRYLYVNNTAAKHGQTTKEQLMGRTMSEAYPGIENTAMYAELRRCMEARTSSQLENEFSYPDGSKGWFELRFEPVPEGLAILSADITARKLADKALRESEQQFRAIFEFASVGIVQVEPFSGKIIQCNDRYLQILGYSREEIPELSVFALTHPDDLERDQRVFTRARSGETPTYQTEKRNIRKDGVVIWVRVNASFLRDANGKAFRTVAVCEDITARKQSEEALRSAEADRVAREIAEESFGKLRQLEQMRDGLVHMIVHDMRSLATSLLISLELLQEELAGKLNDDNAEDLRQAISSNERLNRMTSELLDVSKLETGQMPLECKEHDLAEIVRTAIHNTKAIAPKKEVRILSLGPTVVCCDENILLRVVENLISNGLRHAPRGQAIEITLTSTPEQVRVVIRDEGPGIPKEFQEKIFEKFGALQMHKEKRRQSTGLGLAFCKLAIESHKGRIGVESDEGKGSSFWFTLPLAAV